MEHNLINRFKQEGGSLYQSTMKIEQEGGGDKKVNVKNNENWRKKYIEIKLERDNLLNENKKLRQKLKKYEKK